MQVTETLNEGLKRGYSISISGQELADKVDAKLREAQPTIEMNGVRKVGVNMVMMKKQHRAQKHAVMRILCLIF